MPRLEVTESAAEAAEGLLGREGLALDAGLLIRRCRSIHMFFMRFPIDAVFLDGEERIRRIVENLRPWRMAWCLRGRHVLELPAGAAARLGLKKGQEVVAASRAVAAQPPDGR